MVGVAYLAIVAAGFLTAVFFVLLYRDTMELAEDDDPARRRRGIQAMFWMLLCWPVGLFLLYRLRREEPTKTPTVAKPPL